jgi:hypothetical protein
MIPVIHNFAYHENTAGSASNGQRSIATVRESVSPTQPWPGWKGTVVIKQSALVALAVVVVFLAPSRAHAQRYGRGGVVMGPNGPLYDTSTPEWRASGGNLFLYQQLMEQKMMMQQQQQMLKYQQQLAKQNKNNPNLTNSNTAANDVNLSLSRAKKKKKKTVLKPSTVATAPASKEKSETTAVPASTSKPASTDSTKTTDKTKSSDPAPNAKTKP